MVWLLVFWGCGGAADPAPAPHATGFAQLVDAVVRDDAAAIEQWSEGLVAVEHDSSSAAVTIGAAQGMMRMSVDADERRGALVGIVRGCAECHTAQQLPTPDYTPTGDAELDRAIAMSLFANRGGFEGIVEERQRAAAVE